MLWISKGFHSGCRAGMDGGQSVTSFGDAEIQHTWSGNFLHLSFNSFSLSVPFSKAENSSSSRSTSRHLSSMSSFSFSFPLPLLWEGDTFWSLDKTCNCSLELTWTTLHPLVSTLTTRSVPCVSVMLGGTHRSSCTNKVLSASRSAHSAGSP